MLTVYKSPCRLLQAGFLCVQKCFLNQKYILNNNRSQAGAKLDAKVQKL
jgi:hypothetical protein